MIRTLIALLTLLLMTSCSKKTEAPAASKKARDIHSFARPDEARVRHIDLDLDVVFDQHTIRGKAVLTVEHIPAAKHLILDTRMLQIDEAETSSDGAAYTPARFVIGTADKILGAPLTIDIVPGTKFVRIRYSTSPTATALQWLSAEQTTDKKHPFLYTQSQAIHARSWIPLQDSPGVRVTWEARVKVPAGLKAVMSAIATPIATFRMENAVPPYLIALAVGDLKFQSTGPRTGVWAEPSMVAKAAAEFSDMEKMMDAAEKLYGPYRWNRYDVLVLPASFPFGGMENPCLTFATPTVIAGDKSLVSLVAHELAHSWSGNLVTNATWSDFWLNEGFTVYLERRILESVYGKSRAEMEAVLGHRDLTDEMKAQPAKDQILNVNLDGRDPDDGMTQIPYEKGALFLTQIEKAVGRQKFDEYLKNYFDRFAFQSITTAESLAFMREKLLTTDGGIPVYEWVFQPGLPKSASLPQSVVFIAVGQAAKSWLAGDGIVTDQWSTQEWLHFLHALPEQLNAAQMAKLDAAFHFTQSGNSEILTEWLQMSIRNNYQPARERLASFLMSVGRRKFVKPLYAAMKPEEAKTIYEKARPFYHPITQSTIDALLADKPAPK